LTWTTTLSGKNQAETLEPCWYSQ